LSSVLSEIVSCSPFADLAGASVPRLPFTKTHHPSHQTGGIAVGAAVPQSASSPRIASSLVTRPVWLVGILAALIGAVVAEAFTLVARGAGVPMAAAGVWEEKAQKIGVGAVAQSVVLWSIGGIVLAVVLARWAKRPARTFVVASVAFTALSLAGPGLARDTAVSTQIILAATHVLAAAVIIPILARRLSARDAGR
jgi:FtsH-binding integral membrane protein